MHAFEWHMYKYSIEFQVILEPEALAIFSNNTAHAYSRPSDDARSLKI